MLEKDVNVIENTYNNKTIVNIGGKGGILCDYALLSIGASFDVSMAKEAGINTDRQIIVDNKLQTSITGIYAAGDIAQLSSPGPCSARESSLQGKIAGANVVAYLKDEEQQIYEAEPVPLRFKYRDFELYSIGKTPNIGSHEEILDYKNMELYRACVYEHCALAGVQMVGSNKDFIKLQKEFLASKIWRGK
jgi:pyruvate/2-oxoglutarate dehydrogenase complex dihydrolipoamide dehydrogenase (E3) component